MIAGPAAFVGLVLFGFHRASEGSEEVRQLAYPLLTIALVIGMLFLAVGYVNAKSYCDELWEGSASSNLDYHAEHCSVLWPRTF
jgi:hypothetical protein